MQKQKTAQEWRTDFRKGFVRPTTGIPGGYAQANLLIIPKEYALDFANFCQKNPKPLPLLEMGTVGDPYTKFVADQADIRTDIPKYWIWRDGKVMDEVTDIKAVWNDDLVWFLTGCSFGFEDALLANDIPVRHIANDANCPMYVSGVDCNPSGVFRGKMVVSMRGIPSDLVAKAAIVTSRYPLSHGAPVWVGNAKGLGVKDLYNSDFGGAPIVEDDDVPVFWACGVTAQQVAADTKLPFFIGHAPGHMFITDISNEKLALQNI